jgi:hypothetical protein
MRASMKESLILSSLSSPSIPPYSSPHSSLRHPPLPVAHARVPPAGSPAARVCAGAALRAAHQSPSRGMSNKTRSQCVSPSVSSGRDRQSGCLRTWMGSCSAGSRLCSHPTTREGHQHECPLLLFVGPIVLPDNPLALPSQLRRVSSNSDSHTPFYTCLGTLLSTATVQAIKAAVWQSQGTARHHSTRQDLGSSNHRSRSNLPLTSRDVGCFKFSGLIDNMVRRASAR